MADEYMSPEVKLACKFNYHYRKWKESVYLKSTEWYDSPHFKAIVDMGTTATDFILEEIFIRPDPIVHALDLIYPGKVRYDGCVPLSKACSAWLEIFRSRLYNPLAEDHES